jgi:hypothetical protein
LIHPSKLAMVRLWLSGHNPVVVVASIAVVFGVVTGGVLFPVGPYVHVVGTIVRIGYGVSPKYGRYPAAYVVADGRQVIVAPFPGRSCVLGSSIRLERQRRIWGYSFVADTPACGG